MPKATEIVLGERYGRLVVIGLSHKDKHGKRHLNLKCDCGTSVVADISAVRTGHTASCGCLRRETAKGAAAALTSRNTKHGHAHMNGQTPEYRCWRDMIRRCGNPTHKSYPSYGDRGISVTDRWKSFVYFLDDVGLRPSKAHSLDRIDNNGNYEPGNCRWATRSEQMRNTRRNHVITFEGRDVCVAEAAELSGIKPATLRQRVLSGWSIEEATERA